MKNIDEMEITQKIEELRECVDKATKGLDYPGGPESDFLSKSKLGDEKREKIEYFDKLVKKLPTIVNSNLDYDVKNVYIADLEKDVDNALLAFPGYEKTAEHSRGAR